MRLDDNLIDISNIQLNASEITIDNFSERYGQYVEVNTAEFSTIILNIRLHMNLLHELLLHNLAYYLGYNLLAKILEIDVIIGKFLPRLPIS